jgi:predicted Zn-dependent protease with MMP-like domain
MYHVEPAEFEDIVTKAIESLPKDRLEKVQNILFLVEPEPSEPQRLKLGLRPCQSLFGLYEGVPLTERRGGYAFTLPDRITIFQKTHELFANNRDELTVQVNNTVWHEVAHYFGLNHDRIAELEKGHEH